MSENQRILNEYARREREIPGDRYSVWNPSQIFMLEGRRRSAIALLHRMNIFPKAGDACLEVGYGKLGWLAELIGWGLKETDLYGIELDDERAMVAKEALPSADLRVGDASVLPWPDGMFKLVIASTVFTSILDIRMRSDIAKEITRVLKPGGALLWYDFSFNNPRNPNVRGIGSRELRELFPMLHGPIMRVTLAPPLVRAIVPWSWVLAVMLEAIPLLRSHLMGVFVKSAN